MCLMKPFETETLSVPELPPISNSRPRYCTKWGFQDLLVAQTYFQS